MLSKKERLSRQDFNRFFSLGKRFHTKAFTVLYTPHTELHVSVVVSKKIAAKAVVRNKIRRRVYDVVRHYKTEVGLTGVYIFMTKSGIQNIPYPTLKEEVRACIQTIIK